MLFLGENEQLYSPCSVTVFTMWPVISFCNADKFNPQPYFPLLVQEASKVSLCDRFLPINHQTCFCKNSLITMCAGESMQEFEQTLYKSASAWLEWFMSHSLSECVCVGGWVSACWHSSNRKGWSWCVNGLGEARHPCWLSHSLRLN